MQWGGITRALLLALIGIAVAQAPASADRGGKGDTVQNSVLQVPPRGAFPMSQKISLGASKSILVQFPFELKDVLVSDPEKVDAVVQSSNRVFLIAKKVGQTNAFFFDTQGRQVLTLEVSVGADCARRLVRRFIPGANISRRWRATPRPDRARARPRCHARRRHRLQFANNRVISSAGSLTTSKGGNETESQSQYGQVTAAAASKKSFLSSTRSPSRVRSR
jgi:hypothetical protein